MRVRAIWAGVWSCGFFSLFQPPRSFEVGVYNSAIAPEGIRSCCDRRQLPSCSTPVHSLGRGKAPSPHELYKSRDVRSLADQRQEFGSCFLFAAEATEHGRSYRRRMLFLDATHHHAQMPGLDDNADALGLDGALDGLRNLRGQAFLDLQAAREGIDEARYFAQADDFSIWNIATCTLPKKGSRWCSHRLNISMSFTITISS